MKSVPEKQMNSKVSWKHNLFFDAVYLQVRDQMRSTTDELSHSGVRLRSENHNGIEGKAYPVQAPKLYINLSSLKKLEKLNIKDSKKNIEALLCFVTPEKQQFYKNLLNPDGVLGSELQEAESEIDESSLEV
ncbi:hypothetical protein AVEN_52243-1 [Araneus ventricosus]|uniref:Uncharacterized protein n=1 Tax=Araneus ventricosus TaxID=182803 RepID=A0A4Y2NGL3_ARAVE|nr:hypothetical protein AVEN_52243-1 [Araneus ventricosus]